MTPREDEKKGKLQEQPEKKEGRQAEAAARRVKSPWEKDLPHVSSEEPNQNLEKYKEALSPSIGHTEEQKKGRVEAIAGFIAAALELIAHDPHAMPAQDASIMNVKVVPPAPRAPLQYPVVKSGVPSGTSMTAEDWDAVMGPFIEAVAADQPQTPPDKVQEAREYARKLAKEVRTDLADPKKVGEEVAKEIDSEIVKHAIEEGASLGLVAWTVVRARRTGREKKNGILSMGASILEKVDELLTKDASLPADRIAKQCGCTLAQAKAAKKFWEAMTREAVEGRAKRRGWGGQKRTMAT
jgi:hypothetical protein